MNSLHLYNSEIGRRIGYEVRKFAISKLAILAGFCVAKVMEAFAKVWVREELANNIVNRSYSACEFMLYPAGLYLFRYSWNNILHIILFHIACKFLLEPCKKFLKECVIPFINASVGNEEKILVDKRIFQQEEDNRITIFAQTIILYSLSLAITIFQEIFNVLCVHKEYALPPCPKLNLSIFNALYNNME